VFKKHGATKVGAVVHVPWPQGNGEDKLPTRQAKFLRDSWKVNVLEWMQKFLSESLHGRFERLGGSQKKSDKKLNEYGDGSTNAVSQEAIMVLPIWKF